MKPLNRPININAMTRKLNVDNRISLRNYYRIADNLLKQASIYREEKNLVDLYIILVRFSSLVSETIPCHRDYQVGSPKERSNYRKKLLNVMDEVESLKPRVQRQIDEVNRVHSQNRRNSPERTVHNRTAYSLESSFSKQNFSTEDIAQMNAVSRTTPQTSWKSNNDNQMFSSNSTQVEKLFDKLSVGLPLPKEETLSRHSILGQNGLRGQWLGPSTGMKVYYPSNADLLPENSGLTDCQSGGSNLIMDSVLSLDDGRWQNSADLSSPGNLREDLQINIIRQPSPPPVLAQVQRASRPISPSRVADPRPGPAHSQNGASDSNSYQELHIPVKMMDDFLRLAQKNTANNLETCGVLAGSLKNRVFCITTLIIPKQESTSDSCQTMNEEEIFEYQDRLSLFPLGWIHTHPSQTCFMSSVDLHTHYSYQIMLPEAIAIVMAPTDKSSPFGIFHLGDPGGVSVIRNCQDRGFHTHEEPDDGSPIYEHCSHVYMNPDARFDVADLR
ncbi:ubiquitinyl hydrolase 1 [Ranunculus cassubicifolius]